MVNLTVVPHSSHTWRPLFWVAAGITFFAACLRAILPESEVFLKAREARRSKGVPTLNAASKTRVFLRELKKMLRDHWMLCIYAVLMMTGASQQYGRCLPPESLPQDLTSCLMDRKIYTRRMSRMTSNSQAICQQRQLSSAIVYVV